MSVRASCTSHERRRLTLPLGERRNVALDLRDRSLERRDLARVELALVLHRGEALLVLLLPNVGVRRVLLRHGVVERVPEHGREADKVRNRLHDVPRVDVPDEVHERAVERREARERDPLLRVRELLRCFARVGVNCARFLELRRELCEPRLLRLAVVLDPTQLRVERSLEPRNALGALQMRTKIPTSIQTFSQLRRVTAHFWHFDVRAAAR